MTPIKNGRICWECEARKRYLNSGRELFEMLYLKQTLSTYKIAEIFHCSWYTIDKWLRYYGIPLRKRGGATNLGKKIKRIKH